MVRLTRDQRVAEAVAYLCEALPGKKASPLTFKSYERGLSDLAIEEIEDAVDRAVKSRHFVPSVAELREMCGCLTNEQRTVKAWSILNEAIRRWNYYHSILFDDPALQVTVHNFGGWIALSERWSDTPTQTWDAFFRKDFDRVYAAFLASGSWGEAGTTPLIGWYDKTNRSAGKSSRDYFVEYETGLPALPLHRGQKTKPRQIGPAAALELTESIGRQP